MIGSHCYWHFVGGGEMSLANMSKPLPKILVLVAATFELVFQTIERRDRWVVCRESSSNVNGFNVSSWQVSVPATNRHWSLWPTLIVRWVAHVQVMHFYRHVVGKTAVVATGVVLQTRPGWCTIRTIFYFNYIKITCTTNTIYIQDTTCMID